MTLDNLGTIAFSTDAAVATITLNRPAQFNALNLQMATELHDVAIAVAEDPSVRAVVITGAGKAFFAGGDLSSFAEAGDGRGALLRLMASRFHAAVSIFNSMDAPVIAAVNGVAAGAGFSLMAACDLAIVSSNAKFTMAYTRAGLVPDGSSTYFLARLCGLRRAQELVLTNRTLTADEALEWGLVNRVVPHEGLMAAVGELASELASGPTKAFGSAKRLLRTGMDNTLETQMEREALAIATASLSPDGLEGVAAFMEKRSARFTG